MANGPVTVTSTVPTEPAGLVAVIWVPLFTVKVVAGVESKVTAVAPLKPDPLITTTVPPGRGPVFGVRPETTGSAT